MRLESFDCWNFLGFPVKEYLHLMSSHPESVIRDYNFWTIDRPNSVVISCKLDDFLRDVIKKMCFYKVHRVFVVENKRPIGVIAMYDVLKLIGNI